MFRRSCRTYLSGTRSFFYKSPAQTAVLKLLVKPQIWVNVGLGRCSQMHGIDPFASMVSH